MIKKTNKNSNRKRLTKGGRVKAAKGFPNPTKEPMEKKPIRKPIPQAPRKPIQQGIPSKNTRNIDDPRGPIDTKLPEPVLRAPDNDNRARPRDEGGTGSITSQPVTTSTTLKKAPTTKKEQELNIGKTVEQVRTESQREATPVTPPTTFPRAPVQEDPRDSIIFTQEDKRDIYGGYEDDYGSGGREEDEPIIIGDTDAQTPVGTLKTLPNGAVVVWNGSNWVPQVIRDDEDIVEEVQLTDEELKAKFESARRARMVEAGQSAEDIVAGTADLNLPTAEVQKIMGRLPDESNEDYQARLASYEAEAIKLGEAKKSEAILVDPTAPQEVTTMEAETAQTPEELAAQTYEAEQVGTDVDVTAAEGQVQEDKLAKAAKVDRVAPIEGVDVDIPEGALAERVIGVMSEGAKATAVMNVGSSLSRITRAKKQLSKAGLSDADIAEIGNDPEALEDRLGDFSEEQRGIIEGLPEEALVSTQINGLLEGMEDGNIPVWARPAVAQVEQMLAKRGMSASTVGRDSLFNSIIQAAMPIAQSNAQAIQSSVAQQRNIEAQEAEANAARGQQTALDNAGKVFQMDMAQFSADQQTSLSNSKFMQTVALTEANNDQQATIQNAVLTSQANLAEADFYQKTQINNANAFLQMDLTNLNNQQQANVVKAQQEQQRILSNQSATNAAKQFNSASENQTQQFMAGLESQINQFNVAQTNAATQFNTQSKNVAAARDSDRTADINKANASILNQTNQFNAQLDFNREQWNAANEQAILNSNVDWRRKANLADTAAQNEVNRQNVQNAFGLTQAAQSFLWQELRDQADYDFKWATDTANRKLQAMIAAAGSEGDAAKNWSTNFTNASSTINKIFGET